MSALQSTRTSEIAGLADPTAASDLVIGIAPFVAGLAIAAALIAAVWWGIRIRNREPSPPTPQEQPHRPEGSGPPEVTERREPDEVVPPEGGRLLPHELRNTGNTSGRPSPGKPEERPRWDEKSGGAFGSGGPGG
ncbi:DUF6479 family protein [Streptomyces flavidovirens]|uniref:DUF6479 family protein n=1 Tax=Streptomyces flavidovirens TaxID=67298 RepID=UPI00040A4DBA|nr:DUF6479 family protein [Streptomyces flavidovirens]